MVMQTVIPVKTEIYDFHTRMDPRLRGDDKRDIDMMKYG